MDIYSHTDSSVYHPLECCENQFHFLSEWLREVVYHTVIPSVILLVIPARPYMEVCTSGFDLLYESPPNPVWVMSHACDDITEGVHVDYISRVPCIRLQQIGSNNMRTTLVRIGLDFSAFADFVC